MPGLKARSLPALRPIGLHLWFLRYIFLSGQYRSIRLLLLERGQPIPQSASLFSQSRKIQIGLRLSFECIASTSDLRAEYRASLSLTGLFWLICLSLGWISYRRDFGRPVKRPRSDKGFAGDKVAIQSPPSSGIRALDPVVPHYKIFFIIQPHPKS